MSCYHVTWALEAALDSMVQLSTFNVQQSRGYAIGYATIGIDHRAQGHKGFQILGYLISSSGAYDSDPQK